MSNPIAIPGTVVPIGSLATPGGSQGVQGLQGPQGPAGGSGGTTYTASQSVLLTGTNFTLLNDAAAPSGGQFYGYNGTARGWFTPAGTGYTASQSVLLTGANFTLNGDVVTPANGQYYGYRSNARTWSRPLFINVLDFGADPTGTADSTAAINNAIGGMGALNGCSLYFPNGTYKISSSIVLAAGTYFGDGTGSIISTTSPSADMFVVLSSGTTIHSLSFTSSVTRTGGCCINTSTFVSDVNVYDFYMEKYWTGISVNWEFSAIRDGWFYNGVPNNAYSIIVAEGSDVLIDHISIFNTANIYAGIVVIATPGMFISHVDATNCAYGLLVNCNKAAAPLGNAVTALYVHDSYFDTCGSAGVYFLAQGYAGIVQCRLSNVWATNTQGGGSGIQFDCSGNGFINGVNLDSCHVFVNTGYGILVNNAACHDIRIDSCAVCGNSATGVIFNTGVSDFSVTNCRIGNGFSEGGNGGFGVAFQGSNTRGIVTGNALYGNGSGAQNGAMTGSFINTNNI